jgi:hypothetical protein
MPCRQQPGRAGRRVPGPSPAAHTAVPAPARLAVVAALAARRAHGVHVPRMVTREQIREGMVVRGPDGHEIGEVVFVEADCFQMKDGSLLEHDYLCDFTEVAGVERDEIVLKHGREHLEPIPHGELYQEHPGHQQPHARNHTSPPPNPPELA